MNIICILLLLFISQKLYALHLNISQMKMINNLIQNPQLMETEREKINLILYKAYEKWAIKKAYNFKKFHKYKCSNIKKEDLILSSKIGLFKSIKKYNGKYSFINYSIIYINAELLKTLSEKYSLSIIPKTYRCKNKSSLSDIELAQYNHLLNVKLSSEYETNNLDLIFSTNENILNKINKKYKENEIMNYLNTNLTSFSKRILYLKYNLYPDRELSNKYVSKLMCCSEENIRIKLHDIKNIVNFL